MDRHTELLIDARTERDLHREIAALAASYTPEWRFDPEEPDAGSAIALIFAAQTAGTIRRLNQVMDKYHTEFVNMLGLSLLAAYPASGVVVVDLIPDTVPGISLPGGTKLMGQHPSAADEPVVFETVGDVYITAARLTDILSISGTFGKIIPILGGPRPVSILPQPPRVEETVSAPPEQIPLFDFSLPGVERSAALIYHRRIFSTGPEAEILLRPMEDGTSSAAARLADPARFRWSYYSGEGTLVPFDGVSARAGDLVLTHGGESGALNVEGQPCGLICAEALTPVEEPVTLSWLRLASACGDTAPTFLCHNDSDLEPGRFLPFGDTASLFDECYLGHDAIFAQQGALITLSLTLSHQERLVTLTPQQERDELKIIKRKPRDITLDTVQTAPQTVAFDYFNGLGWRKLPCLQDWSTLFDGSHPGTHTLVFRCPDDWRPTVAGGYEQRCIRLRITRADNCYLQPCIHNMPVVENVSLSYVYDGAWSLPHYLQVIQGTRIHDLTRRALEGDTLTLFQRLPYAGNALYLGFDQRPNGAPVSLLFDMAESVHFQNAPIRFEYSSLSGWKPLKVVDHTANLSSAGTILFLPPADMAPLPVEGLARHWLRLVDADGVHDHPDRHHPLIRAIHPNAVEVRNVETLADEPFYLRAPGPNMLFPLAAENILSLEVFVNEGDRLTQPMMQELRRTRPEDVRCHYNFLGDISDCFVRWTEVESFDDSRPGDRHYVVDRMNNTIGFGDGVHVAIPTVRDGVAFTVAAKCCRGDLGNLPRNALNALRGNLLYINSVYNPIATFGGSNLESLDSAHRRGAGLLCGGGRLVSETDFVRAVRAFSSAVDKVRCLAGRDMDGREDPARVTITVMMRDYADGAYSFHGIRDRLRRHILERCEATLAPEKLLLAEPMYITVSLTVWAETDDPHQAFQLQTAIREAIDAFLDPLAGENHSGWEIGVLPTQAQLGMTLHALRGPGRVARFIATARYVDRTGSHERSLDQLEAGPFAIAVPGRHRIYVELPHG